MFNCYIYIFLYVCSLPLRIRVINVYYRETKSQVMCYGQEDFVDSSKINLIERYFRPCILNSKTIGVMKLPCFVLYKV